MISIFEITLLSQIYGYKEYFFTECSLQVGWFYAENSKCKKKRL